MRLQQILDDIYELLLAESEGKHFKSIGDLRKSQFQNNKSEDDKFLRHDMYAGTIGDPEAAKKGAETRKNRSKKEKEEEYKRAAETRANWYKNQENYEKFMKSIKKRKVAKK